ncbi:signal transduction histidine kinase [Streptomyces puniciscabiei]|uniref:histidine kinase n=1 Tax=Streptomyces puniciscabiei TaxID=164348 RepID=A0A542TH87_9ACTN|nr:sensor histidine kinase [Streptomyces puniciscabiei]TQK86186.1 signal transduction histidine kinase [Streptomyces puniciscabiei]
MRQLGSWVAGVGVGFVRACVVAVVSMLVPAVWAAAVALGIWWRAGNPWSWVAPLVLVCGGTLALSRPVCRMVRFLVARWTATVIPAGYRQAGPVTRMSTGYWWNGFSYERTRRDALLDQKWRLRWRDPANWRDLRFTGILPLTAGVVATLPPAGVAAAVLGLGRPGLAARLVGTLGLVVAVASAPYAWRLVEPVAVRFLRPSPAMALADRVDELTAQRADATVAQAAEIRRIERDLHDGAQARLVALGLSLATAEKLMETDPERAKALMRDARVGATASLAELRELIRGISPPVLNERGLVDAVRALALDIPLDVAVSADARLTLDPPIEPAVYFGLAELLTNAVRHAHASRARVCLAKDEADLVVEVEDDGRGGADERAGGGLAGLRRRLAVFDGTLEIISPPGGPTRVRMVLPCESL